jgi:hypothetical protein
VALSVVGPVLPYAYSFWIRGFTVRELHNL